MDAMIEAYQCNIKTVAWYVIPRLREKSVVSSKWIFKIKYSTYGSIKKYKARFIAQGFSQK